MSDEFFDQLRESSRAKKLARQESNKEIALLLSGEYDIDVETIAPHQIRLSKNGIRLDLFLQTESYQVLNTGDRGSFRKTGIDQFIELFFNL